MSDKPMFVQITVKVEASEDNRFYYSKATGEYTFDFILPKEIAIGTVDLNAVLPKAIEIAVARFNNPEE